VPVLQFSINGNPDETLIFEIKKIINAGYTGRNQEEVQKHINELKEKGIPGPDEIPTYFRFLKNVLPSTAASKCSMKQTTPARPNTSFYVLLKKPTSG